ncbi:MAG: hypothetical protein ABJB74_23335 [Gemmatimonas sp.]
MYSTCLFCNSALGTNEIIEHFPVGRRLAFDGASGRLWVVCRTCERWNLSPLETRWEAIEEAERAFRDTKLRTSTDNIGLARLREGTELVRIGRPLRPEFAAWRYGDQFGKRQRRFVAKTVSGIGALSALPFIIGGERIVQIMSIGPLAGVIMLSGAGTVIAGAAGVVSGWRQSRIPIATVRGNKGELLSLTKTNAGRVSISPAGHAFDWQVKLQHVVMYQAGSVARFFGIRQVGYGAETVVLRCEAARRALATILPHTNQSGGSKRAVDDALAVLGDAPNVQYLMHLAATTKSDRQPKSMVGETLLGLLPSSLRLALEMSLHEDDERRAMEGELKELEQRWREADAIAKIADAMFLPAKVDETLNLLKATEPDNETHA